MKVEELPKKLKKCTSCHKRKASTRRRACGYDSDVNQRVKMEVVCDACEVQHNRDI